MIPEPITKPDRKETIPLPPNRSATTTDQAAMMRPFAEFLSGINRGRACDEMTTKLAKLVAAVTETGRKGTVTLRIEVAPFKGDETTVEVKATTTLNEPSAEHAGVFFFDQQFGLTRDDPAYAAPLFPADGLDGGGR